MKFTGHFGVLGLCAALIIASISGCASSEREPKPGDPRPQATLLGIRPKGPGNTLPITVVRVVPTPTATPSAKGKKAPLRPKSAGAPVETAIPVDFGVASNFWPSVSQEVYGLIKCYEVDTVSSTSVTTKGSALQVFGDSSTQKSITITRNNPTRVYLTFPSSCMGKQFLVGVTGSDDTEEYNFAGGEIFVVSE